MEKHFAEAIFSIKNFLEKKNFFGDLLLKNSIKYDTLIV